MATQLPATPQNPPTYISPKDTTLVMIVDLIHNDAKLTCSICGEKGAIPLLGFCAACAKTSRDTYYTAAPKPKHAIQIRGNNRGNALQHQFDHTPGHDQTHMRDWD